MTDPGWREYLADQEQALRKYGHNVPDDLLDENAFDSQFTEICALFDIQYDTRRWLQLSNKINDSCTSIIKISEGISKVALDLKNTKDNGRPVSLVRKTVLTALKVGHQHKAGCDVLIELQVELNNKVPRLANLNPALDRWPTSNPIQDNLKEIYHLFIKLYMKIIKILTVERFDDTGSLISTAAFRTVMEDAENGFSIADNTYSRNITDHEQADAADLSVSSYTSNKSLAEFKFDFKNSGHIKTGSHGSVYKVQEKTTQEWYACKDIRLSKISRTDDVREEIRTLKKLHHTHIVTISLYSQFEDGFRILMTPLADQDLKEFLTICAEKGFPSDLTNMISPWFACLLRALKFAHAERIKHRDIKLANILVKGSHIYLSDFSLAKDFTDQDLSVAKDELAAGTLRYRAPETRNNVAGHRVADVFSLGCVFSEMVAVICHIRFGTVCEKTNFRDGLPAVKEWLTQLASDSNSDGKVKKISRIILFMIDEEPNTRCRAAEALTLVENFPDLCCTHVQ